MPRTPEDLQKKTLPTGDLAKVLAQAQRCRDVAHPEEAESICLDLLEQDPDNQEALILLLLARTDLLDEGRPGAVDRAREPLARLRSEYDREYYAGLVCQRQAHHLLHTRGRHTSFVAWDWFQFAMDHYEAAASIDPERIEPVLRFNACVRTIERNRNCIPPPEERSEHGIE